MKRKIYTITIGIPAYNEQENIYKLLKSLLAQQLPENLKLARIHVLCDGSTDNTAKRALALKNQKIEVHNFSERMGKNFRLNQLFKKVDSDILVLFDADILISDRLVLSNLTKPFSENKKLGLVAGNAQPLPAKTLVEEAVNNFVYSLNFMKSKIKNGNNIFSVRGPIIAFSKDFVKKISLPANVPDDRFLFLKCLQLKFNFCYIYEALIYYRSPQTFNDQIKQGLRFQKDKENLYKQFNKEFIDKQYFIPFYLKLAMLISQIVRNPIAYLTMKYLHLQIIRSRNKVFNHKWQMVLSSKKLT